ncbi:MAG TPA: carboxymuconolactone decarboxylase family protein [Polyangiaceae bacterium]|nr:carboxymuconolactone decarboxylase family protein [Polyangiaceae bacterium]
MTHQSVANPTNRSFISYDADSAPREAREMLAENQRKFGFLPSPLARLAASPLALQAALTGLSAFEHSSLAPLEREVIAMTMGVKNGCHYCISLHRRLLKVLDAPAGLSEALEQGHALTSPKLEALRVFTLALLERTGDISDESWQQFLAAGFDRAAALEVVVGIATYTLTTFANRLTQAPID